MQTLEKSLIPEINEHYLFHGTKPSFVEPIKSNGLDNRVTSDKAMFGKGIYFSESSTKADQYADDKAMRVDPGQPLHMYVVRVLMGNTFVCRKPTPFVKEPCTQCGDKPTACSHTTYYNSVIGTHRADGNRLIFREFIVYDSAQTYPEFLVKYVRQ
jgi:hypothetical protein